MAPNNKKTVKKIAPIFESMNHRFSQRKAENKTALPKVSSKPNRPTEKASLVRIKKSVDLIDYKRQYVTWRNDREMRGAPRRRRREAGNEQEAEAEQIIAQLINSPFEEAIQLEMEVEPESTLEQVHIEPVESLDQTSTRCVEDKDQDDFEGKTAITPTSMPTCSSTPTSDSYPESATSLSSQIFMDPVSDSSTSADQVSPRSDEDKENKRIGMQTNAPPTVFKPNHHEGSSSSNETSGVSASNSSEPSTSTSQSFSEEDKENMESNHSSKSRVCDPNICIISPLKRRSRRGNLPNTSAIPPQTLKKRIEKFNKKSAMAKRETEGTYVCCTENVNLDFGNSNFWCLMGCRIKVGKEYRTDGATNYCLDHFKQECDKDPSKMVHFESKLNFNETLEPILKCGRCKKMYHQCCSLDVRQGVFVCQMCSPKDSRRINLDGYRRKRFDRFMEEKLNAFLIGHTGKAGKAGKAGKEELESPISVASFRAAQSQPMKEIVPKKYYKDFKRVYGETVHYDLRSIYIFQRIEDVDVLVMVIHCQEYPNLNGEKWCLIDYMDTVAHSLPEKSRGHLYGEVILSYFSYTAQIGYSQAHFFADPPEEQKDDYIFNVHPDWQTYLNKDRLVKWYGKVLEKGKEADQDGRAVISVIRTFEEYRDVKIKKKLTDLRPFDDGLWPRCLKEIESSIEATDKKYDEKFNKRLEEKYVANAVNNFFIELVPFGMDLDEEEEEHNPHEIFNYKDDFLKKCIQKNWQFGTLRRAKYGSVGIINLILDT